MEISLKNLSDKQIADIKKQLEELEKSKTYGRRRVDKGGSYYVIISSGPYEQIELENSFDIGMFNQGEYFLTEKEAQIEYDKRIAITKINDRIDELNEGWEHRDGIPGTYIKWHDDKLGKQGSYGLIPSKIKAIKNRTIGNKIIKEFKEELNLIFNK